jgi:hypothetical protein
VEAQGFFAPSRKTQIARLLEGVLELLADRGAVPLQLLAIDLSISPLVLMVEQLLLLLQQLTPDLTAGTESLGDRRQVSPQMGPAELTLCQRPPAVGTESIAHHDPSDSMSQQLPCRGD